MLRLGGGWGGGGVSGEPGSIREIFGVLVNFPSSVARQESLLFALFSISMSFMTFALVGPWLGAPEILNFKIAGLR